MKPPTIQAGSVILASVLYAGLASMRTMTWAAQPATNVSSSTAPNPEARTRVVEGYGKLPLSFEANRGQTDGRVKFLSRGRGYTLFLTGNEAVLALSSASQESRVKSRKAEHVAQHSLSNAAAFQPRLLTNPFEEPQGQRTDPALQKQSRIARLGSRAPDVLRLKLLGANPAAKATGLDELPGKSNYFIGDDPKKWRTNVANYAKVRYAGVYPGVDLVYYGNQRQLEYDFVVAPGADPKAIQLSVAAMSPSPNGSRRPPLRINASGDLVIGTDGGEVRFHKPVVYQPVPPPSGRHAGEMPALQAVNRKSKIENPKSVDGQYVLQAGNQIGFKVPSYDHTRPLIVDPVLSYSTYLGGSASDGGSSSVVIAVDSSGNAYVASGTASLDFPVTSGAEQTAFGGAGTCTEYYPCGDAFVSKIDPTGSTLLYSTYLGGSNDDYAYGLAVDAFGNAFVTGVTESTNFPTTPGAFQTTPGGGQDNFVTKLNPAGSELDYSTYLGGSGNDSPQALVIDASGNAYVAGSTNSFDFPTTPGVFQTELRANPYCDTSVTLCNTNAFVAKLNPPGTDLVYSTYLGSFGWGWWGGDTAFGLAVDNSGNAAVTGWTSACDFPVTAGAFQATLNTLPCPADPWWSYRNPNAFVSLLNPAGSGLIYSTYFGGSSGGAITPSLALDSAGKIYIVGGTGSSDFPVTPGAFQTNYGGSAICTPANTWCFSGDAFVAKFDPTQSGAASLVYSTFLGGSGDELGAGIAVDASGNAYVCGQTGSGNFPTLNPTQGALGGGLDAFVAKLNPTGSGLLYSTFLGGANNELCDFTAIDASGNAYVAGWTESAKYYPTTPPGVFQPTFGGVRDVFVAKIGPADNTPPGTSVAIQPINGVSLKFDDVTTSGTTAVTQSATGPAPPSGFSLGSPATYFDLSTTATFAGSITVCFSYAGVTFPNGTPQLFHYEGGSWLEVTTSIDTAQQIVCGIVTSLSPFALFSTPTVATVQPPINADGSSVFKAQRGVVPVKFNLAIGGMATCQLPPALIAVFRKSGGAETASNEGVDTLPSDSGSNFRVDGCQYVYNLSTNSLGAGTYMVNISIDGSVVGSGTFGLE